MGAVVLSIGISTAGVTIPLLTSYVLEVSKVAAAKVWFGVSLIQAGVSVTLTAAAGLNGELIPSDVVNLAASLVMVVISAIHLHHTIQFSNTQKMLLTSVDENANISAENTLELTGGDGDNILFGSSAKPTQKLMNQMSQRGWTEREIRKTVSKPYTTRISKNLATGNSATAYYNQRGAYVIVDDITKAIVQISDNINPSTWIPDSNIMNPYKP